jgi:hypothetical protein
MYGRKLSWPNLRYYPGIYLEGQRRITKNLRRVRVPTDTHFKINLRY